MSDFEFEKDDCPLVDIEYQRGYQQGREDERERIVEWCKEQSRILKKQSEDFNDEECFGGYRAFEDMIRHLEIARGGENELQK